ncbi:MAG TPA: LacI family DNA-binding transcriptional regulator [Solirubrobacteraceae bacterium]|jgi:DNA-binding LacI/PurR family transcriptional regulator|nr:LacI family DNA-binding transcriptional regulator [Solirubrobacteraceae bacterium]
MAQTRLRDVADAAGVSIRTVSNVVNGYAPTSEDVRRRVEQAVKELGYRPNVLARNLKQGRTGMIALVVPELDVPYFAELSRAIITMGREHGYTVILDQTDGEPDREREMVMSKGSAAMFDGIILSPLALSRAELIQRDPATPLVLLGEHIAGSGFDHVSIDNVSAAKAATLHLIDLGRQRVAAIGDQPYETGETAQLRTQGYRLAHRARKCKVDSSLIVPTTRFHYADGAAAMEQLLAHPDGPPGAVFCFNDLLALGAIRTLLTRGLRVPEDVAVVGFDDIEAGRFNTPSLTTIAPDKEVIAQLAVKRLLALIASKGVEHPSDVSAPHQLVVRESTTIGRG